MRIERPARSRGEIHAIDEAYAEALQSGPGDHRAIVGAKSDWRQGQFQPGFGAEPPHGAADRAIGGAPARRHHRPAARP